jgi:DNA segregation ATPase FtsK/SpoIIIE-like protein
MSTIRFNPQRRLVAPKVDGGKAPVRECPVAPRKLPLTKSQIIWPAVMGAAFLGMIGLVLTQPGLRAGPMGFFSLFLPIMMLSSFAGIFMQGRFAGGDNKALSPAALEEERRAYMAELDDTRDVIQDDAGRQFANYQFLHPEPGLLRGLVGSVRMWERSSSQEDLALHFGFVRFGTGSSDLAKKLATAPLGESADYEPVCYDALRRFSLEQSKISGIAKPLSLKAIPLMTLVGDDGPDTVYGVVRAMICQAACFHSPQDLKIMVVTDDPACWDWLKWLPHCQHGELVDSGGPARMVWTSPAEMNAAVGQELHNVRKNFGQATDDVRPHWLVINDQARLDGEWDTINRKGVGGVAGVTFVRVVVKECETDGN